MAFTFQNKSGDTTNTFNNRSADTSNTLKNKAADTTNTFTSRATQADSNNQYGTGKYGTAIYGGLSNDAYIGKSTDSTNTFITRN